jgi:hypothetical protein
MSRQRFYFSSNTLWYEVFILQLLFIIVSTTITGAITDYTSATPNPYHKNRPDRRSLFRKGQYDDDRVDSASSTYWKEIANEFNQRSSDDVDVPISKEHRVKHRLGLFHFGRIGLLSAFEGHKSNELNDKNDDKEDHPLRSNLWEMNLNWSFLSPNSKVLFPSREGKLRRGGNTVHLELNPEGYCRIIESTSTENNRDQDRSESPVLALGRWKKRPWGVTIVVRPLFIPQCPSSATELDNAGAIRCDKQACSKENRNAGIIDEQTEFVFHANNFHWNGFGSNPKLTQGTILFQKPKIQKNICWWKSTQFAYSSILPLWPEEASGENDDDNMVVNRSDIFGKVNSDMRRLLGIGTQRRWFRPVVGTFTANGIPPK